MSSICCRRMLPRSCLVKHGSGLLCRLAFSSAEVATCGMQSSWSGQAAQMYSCAAGEYPMTATMALEGFHTVKDRLNRGRTIVLSFTMQVSGTYCPIRVVPARERAHGHAECKLLGGLQFMVSRPVLEPCCTMRLCGSLQMWHLHWMLDLNVRADDPRAGANFSTSASSSSAC